LNTAVDCKIKKNLHHKKNRIMNPRAAKGPYCFSINSQLILTAAFRYFDASSRSLPLISPILSRLSPLYSRSSMFLVITFCGGGFFDFAVDSRVQELVDHISSSSSSKSSSTPMSYRILPPSFGAPDLCASI